jgi:hypothetical protein
MRIELKGLLPFLLIAALPLTAPVEGLAQAVGTISGRVVNADQVGVTDAEVRLPDLARRTTVNEDGAFT